MKSVVRQIELSKSGRFSGVLGCPGKELNERAYEFAETMVDELFIQRCGRNVSKLLAEENSLADGIFFITDRDRGRVLEDRKRWRNNRKASNGQDELESIEDVGILLVDESY